MGFARSLVELVLRCISSMSYSVCLNGEMGERFKPTKGLRQGAVNHKVQTLANVQSIHFVPDLIDQLTNCWKEDVIKNTLCAEDADRILCIPLPVDRQDEKVKLPIQKIETERWRPPETSHVKVNFDAAFIAYNIRNCVLE
ncbi:hypothetical protein PVK06_012687 [Gossypium arboreum]|uniref:Uncharacterized protein n=1 Tax=Gossypium arboreum TaxID=29729 RepID=A0ABR0QD48_GOSAR|nr:hypothetical protein PVK06_012687 [Gossypium arboreum]